MPWKKKKWRNNTPRRYFVTHNKCPALSLSLSLSLSFSFVSALWRNFLLSLFLFQENHSTSKFSLLIRIYWKGTCCCWCSCSSSRPHLDAFFFFSFLFLAHSIHSSSSSSSSTSPDNSHFSRSHWPSGHPTDPPLKFSFVKMKKK